MTLVNVLPFGCFFNCTKLREISLPSNITVIDTTCFKKCKSLKVIEYCGYNKPLSGELSINAEVHVKRDFKGKKFFGLDVIKGYYCGTAPEMTPAPTDVFWELPPPKQFQSKTPVIVLLVMVVVILATFVTASVLINYENNSRKYFKLEEV